MKFIKKLIERFKKKILTYKLERIIKSGNINEFIGYVLYVKKLSSIFVDDGDKTYITIDKFIDKFSPVKMSIDDRTGELLITRDPGKLSEINRYNKIIMNHNIEDIINSLNRLELISWELVKLKRLVRVRKIDNLLINSINPSAI